MGQTGGPKSCSSPWCDSILQQPMSARSNSICSTGLHVSRAAGIRPYLIATAGYRPPRKKHIKPHRMPGASGTDCTSLEAYVIVQFSRSWFLCLQYYLWHGVFNTISSTSIINSKENPSRHHAARGTMARRSSPRPKAQPWTFAGSRPAFRRTCSLSAPITEIYAR